MPLNGPSRPRDSQLFTEQDNRPGRSGAPRAETATAQLTEKQRRISLRTLPEYSIVSGWVGRKAFDNPSRIETMPAPLNVDKEAVRTLVVAVGVREAARQMGLSPATVGAWSARGKWTAQVEAAKARAIATKPVQTIANKPADSLANAIAEDETAVKSSLSRSLRKTAETMQEMPGVMLYTGATNTKAIVSSASQLYGWEKKNDGPLINLNLWGGGSMTASQ